jgi:Fic family protein
MLFKVSNADFFKDNPEAKTIASFRGYNSSQLKFVVLFADPRSPLRNMPEDERLQEALRSVGLEATHKKEFKQHDKLIAAYRRFCGVDSELDSLSSISLAIKDIQDRLSKTTTLEPDDISKLVKSLTELLKQKRAIEEMINDKLEIDIIDVKAEDAEEQLSMADTLSV